MCVHVCDYRTSPRDFVIRIRPDDTAIPLSVFYVLENALTALSTHDERLKADILTVCTHPCYLGEEERLLVLAHAACWLADLCSIEGGHVQLW